MLKFHNVAMYNGKRQNLEIASVDEIDIDASHLTCLPGLIDPHVHFRVPGAEYKEDWQTAALASISGGYTTVMDMPNNIPPCITAERLKEKRHLIDAQLRAADIPLRYHLYFGADKNHFDQIQFIKHEVIGIKVFMGSSTGELLMDDDSSLHAIFALAAQHNLLIAVHAEDEAMLRQRKKLIGNHFDYSIHSEIRSPEVAASAVEKAINLARIYQVRLYVLHVSTAEELALIKQAKAEQLPVYAETTPHHLFLNDNAYVKLRGKAQVNPPLRESSAQDGLWKAIHSGIIDTIGSDHAPHTEDEKSQVYGLCPSGMPGIETTLPLLLTAYQQGRIQLQQIVALTSQRARTIFSLADHQDWVLVDLQKEKTVNNKELKTKCRWSPFHGQVLTGWPIYTILQNRLYTLT